MVGVEGGDGARPQGPPLLQSPSLSLMADRWIRCNQQRGQGELAQRHSTHLFPWPHARRRLRFHDTYIECRIPYYLDQFPKPSSVHICTYCLLISMSGHLSHKEYLLVDHCLSHSGGCQCQRLNRRIIPLNCGSSSPNSKLDEQHAVGPVALCLTLSSIESAHS